MINQMDLIYLPCLVKCQCRQRCTKPWASQTVLQLQVCIVIHWGLVLNSSNAQNHVERVLEILALYIFSLQNGNFLFCWIIIAAEQRRKHLGRSYPSGQFEFYGVENLLVKQKQDRCSVWTHISAASRACACACACWCAVTAQCVCEWHWVVRGHAALFTFLSK